MYFWLKFVHIAAVAVWFSGLAFLPLAFVGGRPGALGRLLFLRVLTPAAVVAVALGTVLILAYGFTGVWLPLKLTLVAAAVLVQAYLGLLLHRDERGDAQPPAWRMRALAWLPLLLFVGVASLTALKPVTLEFNHPDVHTPRSDGGR